MVRRGNVNRSQYFNHTLIMFSYSSTHVFSHAPLLNSRLFHMENNSSLLLSYSLVLLKCDMYWKKTVFCIVSCVTNLISIEKCCSNSSNKCSANAWDIFKSFQSHISRERPKRLMNGRNSIYNRRKIELLTTNDHHHSHRKPSSLHNFLCYSFTDAELIPYNRDYNT